MPIDPNYPSIESLRNRARRRIPGFAFDYLDGGCNAEVNLRRNTEELREVRLQPRYIGEYAGCDLSTDLFGRTYSAPFGIPPIGLQGLVWPRACEILATTARAHGIPFVLSTVGTASIETIAELTDGEAWFQLYHPAEDDLRDKLIARARDAGCPVLVLIADVPSFGYRPKEIRNGLSIPPRMSLRNVAQMVMSPAWSLGQLKAGRPRFATMDAYLPKGLSLPHLGEFMQRTFSGRLTEAKVAAIRDQWPGKLVVKGIVNPEDCAKLVRIGVDGIVVSNHGGRQLDAGQSSIEALPPLVREFGEKLTVMFDSGVRGGQDVACALACGARFVFAGRAFMYGVGALGEKGGGQVVEVLGTQLRQVMEQVGVERVDGLRGCLVG